MKFFTTDELLSGNDVPSQASWIGGHVLQSLASSQGPSIPELLHVGVHDRDDDWSLYEVLVELAPGLVIAANCGLPEDLSSEMTEEELEAVQMEAQDGVIEETEKAVGACTPQLGRLAEFVHQARLKTRRIFAEWSRDGVHARLVDVRLAPYDHWRSGGEPALAILVEALGDRLTPEITEVHVETTDRVAAELAELREMVAHRCARNAELMAQGATGTISRLALNAIDSFGDREAVLRRFATEWRFWLPDDTALLMQSGDVYAGNGRAADPIQWYADRITLDASLVDERQLTTAIGRPVTELVEHEFLSNELIVTGIVSDFDEGRRHLTITLDMPHLLFCSITGRAWRQEGCKFADGDDAIADRGNVVLFRRRAS